MRFQSPIADQFATKLTELGTCKNDDRPGCGRPVAEFTIDSDRMEERGRLLDSPVKFAVRRYKCPCGKLWSMTADLLTDGDYAEVRRFQISERVEEQSKQWPMVGLRNLSSDQPAFFVCVSCRHTVCVRPYILDAWCPCKKAGMTRHEKTNAGMVSQHVTWNPDHTEDVTGLVKCGKLSVVAPDEGQPHLCLMSAHNVPIASEVPEGDFTQSFTISERSEVVGQRLAESLAPTVNYAVQAAKAGARVLVHTHYHSRLTGVETDKDGQKWVQRAATGDAYFCGQVIVSEGHNEPDGRLVFVGFKSCPRCGKDHATPLPFWKLTNPLRFNNWANDDKTETIASHFTFCPSSGEPVIMDQDSLEALGLKTVGPVPTISQQVVAGFTDETSAYQHGWAMAKAGRSVEENPYDRSSPDSRNFILGYEAGQR